MWLLYAIFIDFFPFFDFSPPKIFPQFTPNSCSILHFPNAFYHLFPPYFFKFSKFLSPQKTGPISHAPFCENERPLSDRSIIHSDKKPIRIQTIWAWSCIRNDAPQSRSRCKCHCEVVRVLCKTERLSVERTCTIPIFTFRSSFWWSVTVVVTSSIQPWISYAWRRCLRDHLRDH